ncbi:MAG: ribbon-helix-helix domain-containing protein [Candidatus Dormibacteraceae bacterium]
MCWRSTQSSAIQQDRLRPYRIAAYAPVAFRAGYSPPAFNDEPQKSQTAEPVPLSSWYADIPMRRTTVKLPDVLDSRLRHEAARRGITVSELTREAIQSHLTGGPSKRRLGRPGASGKTDISHRIEEILRSELAAR